MEWLGIDLRRMGTAMLAFGVLGVVVAGVVAIGLIGGAIAARNLDERVAADQARLVASLDRVDSTMAQLVITVDNAAGTLDSTSSTLANAGTVLGRVAATSGEIADAIDIGILGNRPLQGAALQFEKLAVEVRTFQDDAVRLAGNLAVNATDVEGLAAELDVLRGDVGALAGRVEAFEATGELVGLVVGGSLLVGLLVAWIAVAAAACAWVGLRLRRLADDVATPVAGRAPPTESVA